MEVSGQLHLLAALSWGKNRRYQFDRRLWVVIIASAGELNPGLLARSIVSITTEAYRLLFVIYSSHEFYFGWHLISFHLPFKLSSLQLRMSTVNTSYQGFVNVKSSAFLY